MDQTPADLGPDPLPERLISDVETLKALSDPLRLRMLETMTAGHDEAFTVKRLATALGVSQTKLYHHVNLLLERDLIRVVGTRLVSGIVETSYRVSQLSVRLDRGLLSAGGDEFDGVLSTLFDGTRDDIERGVRSGLIDLKSDGEAHHRLVLSKGLARLTPSQAAAFQDRLRDLIREFEGDPKDVEAHAYGFVVAFYPLADLPDEPVEDEAGSATDD